MRTALRADSEHKYEIVKRLRAFGRLVAMTSDGDNDVPALPRANVGIVAVEGAMEAGKRWQMAAYLRLTRDPLRLVTRHMRSLHARNRLR